MISQQPQKFFFWRSNFSWKDGCRRTKRRGNDHNGVVEVAAVVAAVLREWPYVGVGQLRTWPSILFMSGHWAHDKDNFFRQDDLLLEFLSLSISLFTYFVLVDKKLSWRARNCNKVCLQTSAHWQKVNKQKTQFYLDENKWTFFVKFYDCNSIWRQSALSRLNSISDSVEIITVHWWLTWWVLFSRKNFAKPSFHCCHYFHRKNTEFSQNHGNSMEFVNTHHLRSRQPSHFYSKYVRKLAQNSNLWGLMSVVNDMLDEQWPYCSWKMPRLHI